MTYVVDETLCGRSDRIKSYSIGIEVLGRAPDFDASSDAIVRNTARRLRTALAAYYEDEGIHDTVVIHVPKGRYVPEFAFPERSLPDRHQKSQPSNTPPLSVLCLVRRYLTAAVLGIAVATAIFAFAIAQLPGNTISTITVEPTEALDESYTHIATSIDALLAPEMARFGTATITTLPPKGVERTGIGPGQIALSLQSTVRATDEGDPVLLWRLTDRQSGALLSASSEPLPAQMQQSDIDGTIQRLAFKMLGENGVLTRNLSRIEGSMQTRTACLSRGQTLMLIYAESENGDLGQCLEDLTTRYPLDAIAWAVLSTYYTIKNEALGLKGQSAEALERAAEIALHRAIDLAPSAYATQVAQMYLSFNQGRFADFDAVAERLLASYPGDAYLQVRIANRYIRLGRVDDGAVLLAQAIAALDIMVGHEFSGMALASYHAGRYEEALAFLNQSGPTATDLPMLLRIAILGQLGDREAAQQAAEAASETAPDLMADFPRILRDRKWSDDIIEHISKGIQKAEILLEGAHDPTALSTAPPR